MKITKKLLEELIKEELDDLVEAEEGKPGYDYTRVPGGPTIEDTLEDILRRLNTIEARLKIKKLNENPAIPAMALADKFLVEPNRKVDKFTSKSASPMARQALRQVSALKKRVAELEKTVDQLDRGMSALLDNHELRRRASKMKKR